MHSIQINVVIEHSVTGLYEVIAFFQCVFYFVFVVIAFGNIIVVEDDTDRISDYVMAVKYLQRFHQEYLCCFK